MSRRSSQMNYSVNNIDIAEAVIDLMTTIGFSLHSDDKRKNYIQETAQAIIDKSARVHNGIADTQEVYLEAIRLIGDADTPRKNEF